MLCEKPLESARTINSCTTSSSTRENLLMTTSNSRRNISSTSKDNSSSVKRKFKKETNAHFENLYVKTGSAVRDERRPAEKAVNNESVQYPEGSGGALKGSYKRSVTPHRTLSEREALKRQRQQAEDSAGDSCKNIKLALDKDVKLAKLQEHVASLQFQLKDMSRENQQLQNSNSTLQERLCELDQYNQSLLRQLDGKANKLANGGPPEPNRARMLLKLKQTIQESRKAELEQDRELLFQSMSQLRNTNTRLEGQLKELKHELEFKQCIIRNYETAASLPSAREEFLTRQAVLLKEQLKMLNKHMKNSVELETQQLRQRNCRLQRQLESLRIRLHCLNNLHQQQKIIAVNEKSAQLTATRNRLNRFMRDYELFRRECTGIYRQNLRLKAMRHFQSSPSDDQLELSFSLD